MGALKKEDYEDLRKIVKYRFTGKSLDEIGDVINDYCPGLYSVKCWIAGGFIRDFIVGDEPRDLDVYFGSEEEREKTVIGMERNGWVLEQKTRAVNTYKKVPIGWHTDEHIRKVQLICFRDDTPENTVRRFDFHACSVAYDWERLICTKGFMQDVAKKKLTVNSPWYPEDSLKRVERFRNRGWTCDPQEVDILQELVDSGVDSRVWEGHAMHPVREYVGTTI